MAKYEITTDKGKYEIETEDTAQNQAPSENPRIQPQNILGQLLNVPGAAIRGGIQAGLAGQNIAQGYAQGALNPDQVPSFQNMQGGQNEVVKSLMRAKIPNPTGMNPGQLADMATNPTDILGLLPMGKAVEGAGAVSKALQPLSKFDNVLTQAEKAKTALDTLRTTLGKAKEIALQDVKDVPAILDWSGNVSQKVVNAIKNPIYQVEFDEAGGVVNTIGNLDKVKTALSDIVTAKDFVEASNMEKRQILQFAGRVRDAMVTAANKAGKPELGQALKDYHEFMDRYNLANDHLVDKYGNAMANKLKTTFQIQSEPAVKQAWNDLSQSSPEIKGIVDSRKNRELLKNLLKVGATGATLGLGGTAIHMLRSQ